MISSSKRFLVLGLMTCFASLSWGAIPANMKMCGPSADAKAEVAVENQVLSIAVEGKEQDGKPYQASSKFAILDTQEFVAADFSAESLSSIHAVAGITSFTGGTWMSIHSGASQSSIMFFEFSPGQYSVVWIVEGYPISLGKTDLCK
jgi:hypothetical protein